MSNSLSKPPSSFKTLSSLVQSQLDHNKQDFAPLRHLQKIWQKSLPKALASHSNVASFNEREIVVYADSPVWANKLTHNQQKLLKTLHSKGCTAIRNLVIRVTPSTPTNLRKPKPHSLSEHASDCLSTAAADISDPGLKQALLKLSRQSPQTRKKKHAKLCDHYRPVLDHNK